MKPIGLPICFHLHLYANFIVFSPLSFPGLGTIFPADSEKSSDRAHGANPHIGQSVGGHLVGLCSRNSCAGVLCNGWSEVQKRQPLLFLPGSLLFHLLFLQPLVNLLRLLLEAYKIGVRPLACELYAAILRTLGCPQLAIFEIAFGQAVVGVGRVWVGVDIALE